jgi:hypothetical protein
VKLRNMRKFWESNPEAASGQPLLDTDSAPTPETSSSDQGDLFSDMVSHYEGERDGVDSLGEEDTTPEAELTPPAQAHEAEPVVTEAPATAAVSSPSPTLPESTEQPATAQPTPVQPQAPAEPQAQTPPPQLSTEEQKKALEEQRKAVLPQLQERYKLDAETVAELESNPGEVLPRLMAELHYDVTQALFTGIMSQIPQMVTQQTKRAQQEAELEGKFYGKYPGLKTHPDVVNQALAAAMQSGIATTYEQVEQVAATMAAIRLGVPVEQLMGKAPAPTSSAPPPAATPANVARPIAPNASGAPMSSPSRSGGQADLWAEMVDFEMQEQTG